jgi:arylamine N-acetyltransferase
LSNGKRYIVDVAFGGDCPTQPLLLVEDNVTNNLGNQQVRYVREPIELSQTGQKFWQYQFRNSIDQLWRSFYCFTESEFIHQDFVVMNHFTSTSPLSFHTTGVFVVKFVQKDGAIVGKTMLVNGTVKRNTGGKTEVVKVCFSEEERIVVLKDIFNIRILEDEAAAIQGLVTELREARNEFYCRKS